MPHSESSPTLIARLMAGLLLVGGALGVLGARIGAVAADVPEAAGRVADATWLALLPGLVAAICALARPLVGLAATAGAGLMALVRVLPDLAVWFQPEKVARPELFYPLSGRAYPVGSGTGAVLLVLADLLAIVAGIVATRAVLNAAGTRGVPSAADEDDRPARNVPMLAAGFIGVAVLGVTSALPAYGGGYITERLSEPGSDLGSLFAPFVVALVGIGLVLAAGSLPKPLAPGLLVGAATAAAVPVLVGMVVAASDAPVNVSPTVWVAAVGALVIGATGWLTKAGDDVATEKAESAGTESAGSKLAVLAAAISIAAGLAVLIGSRLDLLRVNGTAETPDASGFTNAATYSPSWLLAGVALLLAGLAGAVGVAKSALLTAIGRAGRAATVALWAAPLWPLAGLLADLDRFHSGTDAARQLGADLGPGSILQWSVGPGTWLVVVGVLLAIAAAVASGLSLSRDRDELDAIVDDESAANSHRLRWLLAGGLVVASVVALAFEVYRSGGGTATPHWQPGLFGFGSGSSSVWGGWTVLAAIVVAVCLAASTRFPAVAAGAVAGAAIVVGIRLVIPPAERAAAPFVSGFGVTSGWLLVAVLVLAGAAMAQVTGRITVTDMGTPAHVERLPRGAASQ